MEVKRKPPKGARDVVTNAHRVFSEFIERSEQPPQRGNLKRVPSVKAPAKAK